MFYDIVCVPQSHDLHRMEKLRVNRTCQIDISLNFLTQLVAQLLEIVALHFYYHNEFQQIST